MSEIVPITCDRVRALVEAAGKNFAIVIAGAPDGTTQFVTWGRTPEAKVYASDLSAYLGEHLCGPEPPKILESFHEKGEAARNKAELERLRDLLKEYADHAADSGWSNLAAEIRRRAALKQEG